MRTSTTIIGGSFEVCFENEIKLEMEWVPRRGNELADYISCIRDFDDWMINPYLFRFLEQKWDPHTVDSFAGEHKSQTPSVHSRFWCPGSEAIDTFTVNWGCEVCWLQPCPLSCHARASKAQGTLVLPLWKSTLF